MDATSGDKGLPPGSCPISFNPLVDIMAKVLKSYQPTSKYGPVPIYPWDTWFDGKTRRLTQGKDFDCELVSMEDLIRKTARKRDFPVSVFKEPYFGAGSLVIQPKPKPKKKWKRK